MSDLWSKQRWHGIVRDYTAADVERLRGTLRIEYTLADRGARQLWHLLHHVFPACIRGSTHRYRPIL